MTMLGFSERYEVMRAALYASANSSVCDTHDLVRKHWIL